MKNDSFLEYLEKNKEMAVEILRIYLGLVFIMKGVQFMGSSDEAKNYMELTSLPFMPFLSIHLAAITHIAGGILMMLGLITRIAALIQIPALLGAIFFVHWQKGLFGGSQDLEYVILILFLLLFFVIYGGGIFSIDYYINKRKS